MVQTPSTPLEYAQAAVDTLRRTYPNPADLPPIRHFHYHQGVLLSGVHQIYLIDNDESYLKYIKGWIESNMDGQGHVLNHDPVCLDDIQPGILLFPLYDHFGSPRYKTGLDQLADDLEAYPKNDEGGFWHNDGVPRQMWLDGLYMGGPFMVEYGTRFGRRNLVDEAVRQALLMQRKTRVPETGLWRHAYDPDRKEPWADPVTGLSPEYWGRSIGWVPMAVVNELELLPQSHPGREDLRNLVRDLLTAVCCYQGPDGRWWQVLDKAGREGNWPENSCTCLFVAAICKAVDQGILDKAYLEAASKGYEGVIKSLEWQGDDLLIGDICVGTGPGSYEEYCQRPTSINDMHGVGSFLLMCAGMERVRA